MVSEPLRKRLSRSVGKQVDWMIGLSIHQDRAVGAAPLEGSGKGNGVAAIPSPKNRAGTFRYTRLKPFISPVLPDAVSLRVNADYELVGDRWDGGELGFLPDLSLLLTARAHGGCASL